MNAMEEAAQFEPAQPVSPARFDECVNDRCPWSGDAVQADSLASYRGQVVGFCNTGCRDKFVKAASLFDGLIGRKA